MTVFWFTHVSMCLRGWRAKADSNQVFLKMSAYSQKELIPNPLFPRRQTAKSLYGMWQNTSGNTGTSDAMLFRIQPSLDFFETFVQPEMQLSRQLVSYPMKRVFWYHVCCVCETEKSRKKGSIWGCSPSLSTVRGGIGDITGDLKLQMEDRLLFLGFGLEQWCKIYDHVTHTLMHFTKLYKSFTLYSKEEHSSWEAMFKRF